jgi:hypothetical protein
MALQNLTRCLLAAGGISDKKGVSDERGNAMYLLYINPERSSLSCAYWKGDSFGKRELLANEVRPNSVASYLITPSGEKVVIYISSSNVISGVRYDEEEEDWVADHAIAALKNTVDPDGKLTAVLDVDGHPCVFFEDTSKRLVYLDNAWAPAFLPADLVKGSPLATSIVGGKVYVFYISAKDNCMHYVTQEGQQGGDWCDTLVSEYAFEKKPKRFLVTQTPDSRKFESYVLTDGNALLQINAEGKGKVLGKVDETGLFTPIDMQQSSIITIILGF